jgi:hypothetical protein
MQQSCTYGSVRGALGQPASLPRQYTSERVFATLRWSSVGEAAKAYPEVEHEARMLNVHIDGI